MLTGSCILVFCILVLRGRRRQARSVFDGFRDFQAEARKYLQHFIHKTADLDIYENISFQEII